ncbi:MAG: hypothetical protein P4L59_10100 [Desulfosporosinus sp.]|nr:hypothetical protein [Desulfosporosinus sp.]
MINTDGPQAPLCLEVLHTFPAVSSELVVSRRVRSGYLDGKTSSDEYCFLTAMSMLLGYKRCEKGGVAVS